MLLLPWQKTLPFGHYPFLEFFRLSAWVMACFMIIVGLMIHFLAFAQLSLVTSGFHTRFSSGPICCSCLSPLCFSATARIIGITKISFAKLAKSASSKQRKPDICSFSMHTRKGDILVSLLIENRWSFISFCCQLDRHESLISLILLWSPNLIQMLDYVCCWSA